MSSKFFKELRAKDPFYEHGTILSSMASKPLSIAVKAFFEFLDTNAGDLILFKNIHRMERYVVKKLVKILGCINGRCSGYIVSGGSEANFLSLWLLRNYALKNRRIRRPEIVASYASHYSIIKAANALGLKIIYSRLTKDYKTDPDDVAEKVSRNTIAVVANVGSVELGTVDSIKEIAKVSLEHNIPIHVDAAFGGFILSIMENLKFKKFPGFTCNGVYTVTADPHKTLFTPIPSGGFFVRDHKFLKHIRFKAPYLPGKTTETLIGTRSGGSIASIYAVLKFVGLKRLKKIYEKCYETAFYFYQKLLKIGKFKVYGILETPIICFKPLTCSTDALMKKLWKKGWTIYKCSIVDGLRLVFMPHVNRANVDKFLSDLISLVEH